MPNKGTFLFILLILFAGILPTALWAQEEELIEQELDWGDVDGAWGYEVVIREESGGKEVLRTIVRESRIDFFLVPGSYEFSVAVLNKFKKPVASTDWKPLIIKTAIQPVIRDFSPRTEYHRPSEQLILKADVFQVSSETEFFLISESGESIPGDSRLQGEEKVEITFPMDRLGEGQFILLARDPSGLEDQASAMPLELIPVTEPNIKSVDTKNLLQGSIYEDIEVQGENFEEGIRVELVRGDTTILPIRVRVESENVLYLTLSVGTNPPGRYDLEVTNSAGEKAVRKNSFTVEPIIITEDGQVILPRDSMAFLFGYTLGFINETSTGKFDPLPYGLLLKLRHDLSNFRFWRTPGLRPFGVELAADSSHMEHDSTGFNYHQVFTWFYVYYELDLTGGWALIPKAGSGVSNLWVSESGFFEDMVQGDAGYGAGLGLSLQKSWPSGFFLEGGADLRFSRYTGGEFGTLHPWFAGGLRF